MPQNVRNRNYSMRWPNSGSFGNNSLPTNLIDCRPNFSNNWPSNHINPYFANVIGVPTNRNIYPSVLLPPFSGPIPPPNFTPQMLIRPPVPLLPHLTTPLTKLGLIPINQPSTSTIPVTFPSDLNSSPANPIISSIVPTLTTTNSDQILNPLTSNSTESSTLVVAPNFVINDTSNDTAWLNLLNPAQKALLDSVKAQQDEFEQQYQNWLKEFDIWRESNASHPDNESYRAYSQQWEEWKDKLLAKREQMQKLFTQTLEQLKSQIHQKYQSIAFGQTHFFPTPLIPSTLATLPQVSQDAINAAVTPSVVSSESEQPPIPSSNRHLQQQEEQQKAFSSETDFSNSPANIPLPETSQSTSNLPSLPEKSPAQSHLASSPQSPKKDFVTSLPPSQSLLTSSSNSDATEPAIINNSNSSHNSDQSLSQASENNQLNEISNQVQNEENNSKSLDSFNSHDVSQMPTDKDILISEAAQTIIYILKRRELIKTIEQLDLEVSKNREAELLEKLRRQENKNMSSALSESDTDESSVLLDEMISNTEMKPFDFEGVISQMKSIQAPKISNSPDVNKSQSSSTPLFPSCFNPDTSGQLFEGSNNSLVSQFSSYASQSDPAYNQMYPRSATTMEMFNEDNYSHESRGYQGKDKNFGCHRPWPVNQSSIDNPSSYKIGYVAKTIDYEHGSNSRSIYSFESSNKSSLSDVNQCSSNYYNVGQHGDNYLGPKMGYYPSNQAHPTSPTNELNLKETQFLKPTSLSGKVSLYDLIMPGGREFRPRQIVIILRGFPGSGKTFLAKCIKDKEVELGGSAPRILSLDDYFMVEKDSYIKDETGRKVAIKDFVYEYEREMEENYRISLLKALKKTIDDGFFSFIIIDAINQLVSHFEHFYNYAIKKGFTVYICEMNCVDVNVCYKRNVHNRSIEDIRDIAKSWEPTPKYILQLDSIKFLQSLANHEVSFYRI